MKLSLGRAGAVAGLLGAAFACSASGEVDPSTAPIDPTEDGGGLTLDDASTPPRDASLPDGLGAVETCSSAGWCISEPPADGFFFKDVWAVGQRAFAIGNSESVGIKFLEWDAAGGWKFIDKGNDFSNFTNARAVWAPDEDEVFVVIADLSGLTGGAFGAIIMRGTRPPPPEVRWDWTRTFIRCPAMDATATVGGSGRDDVYAIACGNVFRLNRGALAPDAGAGDDGGDGGETASPWVEDYVDGDASNPAVFGAIAGTAPDDMWFVGQRGKTAAARCVVALRKTPDGYTTVIDGVPTTGPGCTPKPDVAMLGGALASVHAPMANSLVGTTTVAGVAANELVMIALADGAVQVKRTSPAPKFDVQLTSPWGTSMDDLWIVAHRAAGGVGGSVMRASALWSSDAGTFDYSTLVINGAPNTEPLERLRGTSNENLWAVGRYRAYVKSSP